MREKKKKKQTHLIITFSECLDIYSYCLSRSLFLLKIQKKAQSKSAYKLNKQKKTCESKMKRWKAHEYCVPSR